jgi:hypothetical protein
MPGTSVLRMRLTTVHRYHPEVQLYLRLYELLAPFVHHLEPSYARNPETLVLRMRLTTMRRYLRSHALLRSMRSMRGGFISRSRGPLQKVCHGWHHPFTLRPHMYACLRSHCSACSQQLYLGTCSFAFACTADAFLLLFTLSLETLNAHMLRMHLTHLQRYMVTCVACMPEAVHGSQGLTRMPETLLLRICLTCGRSCIIT